MTAAEKCAPLIIVIVPYRAYLAVATLETEVALSPSAGWALLTVLSRLELLSSGPPQHSRGIVY